MIVTEKRRKERALKYLEEELQREKKGMEELEGLRLYEIIGIRNEKHMYIARIEQKIRNVKYEIERMEEKEAS